ncbi:hypothetical protein BGZ97_001007 [Linnemannia gamsii]|jgi:hypothetical protein|uniref:Uncharacterized protein n=1 Tax=Linnemannia gamsii TaxID=64522 RepID=A0A9P6R197_9FUNG|nr:hypothetical protein BGZ97_001007 [Linnemannia gamsii]
MLRWTHLAVAAIIQVVAFSAVTALDPGRYTIGRGNLFLIPGTRSGDVMATMAGQNVPVWILNSDTASTGAETAETLYTFQFEAAVDPKRYMSYNDPAAAETSILTKPISHPFRLQLVNIEKRVYRILPPPPENNLVIRGGGEGALFAKFGVVDNTIITEQDNDMWTFTPVV